MQLCSTLIAMEERMEKGSVLIQELSIRKWWNQELGTDGMNGNGPV